jgi:hypothetical protein
MNYILDENNAPKAKLDIITWAQWYETSADQRIVAQDKGIGDAEMVSTVFLGSDHNFGVGPPLLYETLVFGGTLDEERKRYSTREAALLGHAEMLNHVRASCRTEG